MKKLKLLLIASLMMTFACSEEDLVPDIEVTIQAESKALTTFCDIAGPLTVCPNSSGSYTYNSFNVDPINVTWTVLSGAITIVSGQGTSNVVLFFDSNFTVGSIRATGIGGEICSDTITIYRSNVTCPDPPLDIVTLIPACYPAQYPYGRYRLTGYPNGATITWSANNANIVLTSYDEVYIAPTSKYDFKIIATVTWPKNDPCSPGEMCSKTYYENFTPESCVSDGPF